VNASPDASRSVPIEDNRGRGTTLPGVGAQ
jgi:hypothetical protein